MPLQIGAAANKFNDTIIFIQGICKHYQLV